MIDKKIPFILSFFLTMFSTVCVAVASALNRNPIVYTMLYAIATMWFIGILSQIIFRQLYLGIVRPVEEEKERAYAEGERLKQRYDLEKIEEIDMVTEKK